MNYKSEFLPILFLLIVMSIVGYTHTIVLTSAQPSLPSIPGLSSNLGQVFNSQPYNLQGTINDLNSISTKIPNQYIVVLKDDSIVNVQSFQSFQSNIQNLGGSIQNIYQNVLNGYSIMIPDEKVLEMIKQNPDVAYVEQDFAIKAFAQTLPTGINRVDGDLSVTKSGDGKGSVNADLAILDTGIDLNHPDLNVYRDISFVSSANSGMDDNGHGTHVAGIAAAKDNSAGVVGMAPGARLWSVKILDKTGAGSISTLLKGIDYVTQHANEIDVVNLSLGCQCNSKALNTAISNSVKSGVTYVVAAGNDGNDAGGISPANHPDVITVSALSDSDGKCGGNGPGTNYGNDDSFASFSNYGPVVDIAAPGVKIYSTYKGSSYATLSGTSMASPHVAGEVALYKSLNSNASPSNVRSELLSIGSKPSTKCDGSGRGYFTGSPDSTSEPLLYAGNLS